MSQPLIYSQPPPKEIDPIKVLDQHIAQETKYEYHNNFKSFRKVLYEELRKELGGQ
jgi:hypothetical protein